MAFSLQISNKSQEKPFNNSLTGLNIKATNNEHSNTFSSDLSQEKIFNNFLNGMSVKATVDSFLIPIVYFANTNIKDCTTT